LQFASKALAASRQSTSIVAALSELAAEVQKRRTVNDVLETAGTGILRLGMRLYAFQVTHVAALGRTSTSSTAHLVLRYVATARSRLRALEDSIGRPLRGLTAPLLDLPLANEVVVGRRILHRVDLDLFHSFIRRSTPFDPATLDAAPETAGINNGVLAPIFVREQAWGLLGVVSHTLERADADAIALFATHVGSALEVAESIEALDKAKQELEACQAELARARNELARSERLAALGELAAMVAHEARNPMCVLLHSIRGLREFVTAGSPAEKAANAELFASMADEEAEQLKRIVDELVEGAPALNEADMARSRARAPASLPFFSRAR
jgi:signal transduction histidine kinase